MIANILNYVYAGAAGVLAGIALTTAMSMSYYGAKIDALTEKHGREKAEAVATESKRIVRWVDTQTEVVETMRASLKEKSNENAKQVAKLEKTVADLRGKLQRGSVFVDAKAGRPSGGPNAGTAGTPAPEGGNSNGVLSGQTSNDLLDYASDAEMTRLSLIEQRNYALQCYTAHNELAKRYNGIVTGQDKP